MLLNIPRYSSSPEFETCAFRWLVGPNYEVAHEKARVGRPWEVSSLGEELRQEDEAVEEPIG